MVLYILTPTQITVHGLDDLRMIFFNMRTRINVWADQSTQNDLIERFKYAFVQPEASLPSDFKFEYYKGITSIEEMEDR